MWHLLKAELITHKYRFLLCLFLPIFSMVYGFIGEHPEANARGMLNVGSMAIWIVLMCTLLTEKYRTQTNRRYVLLPITVRAVGIFRIAIWLLLYSCCVALVSASTIFLSVYHAFELVQWVKSSALFTNGLILCAIPSCFIGYDLVNAVTNKIKGLPIKTSIIVGLFLSYKGLRLLNSELYEHYQIPQYQQLIHVIALILIITSIYTFRKRRSYLA